MELLRAATNIDDFFQRLATARRCALLLDYDGTLAPFHLDPLKAVPYPGIPALLDRIMTDGRTRVVIISGRWTRDLLPLLGLRHTPEVWGSHGWERLHPDGRYELAPLDEAALQGLAEADTWAEDIRALGGRIEPKPASLAIHWRGLHPDIVERLRRLINENWCMKVRDTGLELHEFNGGLELRVPGRDKGDAVRTVCAETADHAAIAYLGDDLTDEDAFLALPEGGFGVLVRSEPRASAADAWIPAPHGLLNFLTRWQQTRKP